jgi:hypothetical protein
METEPHVPEGSREVEQVVGRADPVEAPGGPTPAPAPVVDRPTVVAPVTPAPAAPAPAPPDMTDARTLEALAWCAAHHARVVWRPDRDGRTYCDVEVLAPGSNWNLLRGRGPDLAEAVRVARAEVVTASGRFKRVA